jgi:hypothetical protein
MPCADEYADENRKATPLLCRVCRGLEDAGTPMSPELQRWWEVHKVLDAGHNDHTSEL